MLMHEKPNLIPLMTKQTDETIDAQRELQQMSCLGMASWKITGCGVVGGAGLERFFDCFSKQKRHGEHFLVVALLLA